MMASNFASYVLLAIAGCGSGTAPSTGSSVAPPGGSSGASAATIAREIWTGNIDAPSVRDPMVFAFGERTTILAGTGDKIVEYDVAAPDIATGRGKGYQLGFFQDGKPFARANIQPWEVGFHRWESGPATGKLYLYCSLWTPAVRWDFTKPDTTRDDRRAFAFVPLASTRRTAGGFPLDWTIENDGRPIYDDGTAGVDVVEIDGTGYLLGERRLHQLDEDGYEATCLVSRKMINPTSAPVESTLLLCPGRYLGDGRWDVRHPYPSETIKPNVSLVEGTRIYRSKLNGTYYAFYSSGDYNSRDNYGGFIAVCKDLGSPCSKLMAGDDVRVLIPGALPDGHTMVGRPFPIATATGLANIAFHARHPIDRGDDILRCSPSRELGDQFLVDFEAGRATCAPGPARPACGDGTCAAGEHCAADCARCDELAFSIAATRTKLRAGDSVSATATIRNRSSEPTAFGVEVTLKLYRDGVLAKQSAHGPLYFAAGETRTTLPRDGEIIARAPGSYRLEVAVRGGACTWTAETSVIVEPRGF